jgi:hypothetical protein
MVPRIQYRITYNPDGTIVAEMYPGTVNVDYWLDRVLNLNRFEQYGNGIWLKAEITQKEADYMINTIECTFKRKDVYEIIDNRESQGNQPDSESKSTECSFSNETLSLF